MVIQRTKKGIADANGKLIKTVQPKTYSGNRTASSKRGTNVLGRETLKEICADMDRLRLPTWVSPAPRHPGEKKYGKFTADQWRSFCIINLVYTLTRLWGMEPEGSTKRKMLDNFLDLVSAIRIATQREITPDCITKYEKYMKSYLTGVLKLYPGTKITPYQHLALHIGPLLQRFGPTHSWRTFPFERYNNLLQNIQINNKLGKWLVHSQCSIR
jgi:hypothetical protein